MTEVLRASEHRGGRSSHSFVRGRISCPHQHQCDCSACTNTPGHRHGESEGPGADTELHQEVHQAGQPAPGGQPQDDDRQDTGTCLHMKMKMHLHACVRACNRDGATADCVCCAARSSLLLPPARLGRPISRGAGIALCLHSFGRRPSPCTCTKNAAARSQCIFCRRPPPPPQKQVSNTQRTRVRWKHTHNRRP